MLIENNHCGYYPAKSYFTTRSLGSPTYINEQSADQVKVNNPMYSKFSRTWKVMRDCIEGQDAVRSNAESMNYLQIPAGVIPEQHSLLNEGAKFHYINKAHYIEVVPRMLDEVEGRIFSKKYKLKVPDALLPLIDSLDSEGLSFDQYVRWCVREVFGVNRFGQLIDWDEELDRPIFKRYAAESIVNWKVSKTGRLRQVVLEDEIEDEDEEQIFSHNMVRRRVAFLLEKDSNGDQYVVQRTFLKRKETEGSDDGFEESEAPVALARRGRALSEIPFIFFGGVKPTAPMLKPLAAASLDFFDAHASYRQALWWATTEQPYITFDTANDTEYGFFEAPGEEDGEGERVITWGSENPIMLKNGEIKSFHVSGIGLTAARQRLIDAKAEMTGLGARSFNAQTASNIKVQTERMQQRAEGSVIASLAFSISIGIKQSLEVAAEWNDISGDCVFELNQDYTDDFEIPFLKEISEVFEKDMLPQEMFWNYLRINTDFVPEDITNEQIQEMLDRQRESFNPFSSSDVDEDVLGERNEA